MKIFDAEKFFNGGDKYNFMRENDIKPPTGYALLLGGYFIEEGHEVIFEQRIGKMHVDLYIPSWDPYMIIEVMGEREPEQVEQDKKRDQRLSCLELNVRRYSNDYINHHFDNQGHRHFLAVNAFEKQIRHWMENGIPDLEDHLELEKLFTGENDEEEDITEGFSFDDEQEINKDIQKSIVDLLNSGIY